MIFHFLVFILQLETFFTMLVCGPALVESGIPEWFNDKSTNSFGTIRIHTDLGSDEWKGYAIFIVYQVPEPRKRRKRKVVDGGNSNFPYFICQFQVNEVDVTEPLVLCAPGVPCVGVSGFWVYISAMWFFLRRAMNSLGGAWSNLEASITTGSLNVEVKECGARVVRDQHDASQFYQVLNSISPRGLDLEIYENLFSRLDNNTLHLNVNAPIISNGYLGLKESKAVRGKSNGC
jgi:hypothetical protein